MPAQDTSQLKEKIISILRSRGPSLPVHIAQATELSMLFASAFLSELLSEKKIKISNMKIGNSPIYFLQEQKPKLENFAHHLKSKEKEAFTILQEKKILKDKEQGPAIRIALRAIKDFAIPFKKEEELFWKYFTIPENGFLNKERKEKSPIISKKENEENNLASRSFLPSGGRAGINEQNRELNEANSKEKPLNIFEKPEKKQLKKKIPKRKIKKPNEKLFLKVKEFIAEENLEIIDFQSFSKDELILKIKENEREKLLIAYNKKRITELDLIKTCKKLKENKLPYMVLSLGNPSKKFSDLIKAIKKIDKIKKIEEPHKES